MTQTTFGERCKHKRMRPYARKVHDICLRCSCGKTRRVRGIACSTCGPKADAYTKARREEGLAWAAATTREGRQAVLDRAVPTFTAGCEGCFAGLTVPNWIAPCCCYQRRRKCSGCENVPERSLPHVCMVETADELDAELAMATMPSPQRAGYDVGERASKRGYHAEGNGPRA